MKRFLLFLLSGASTAAYLYWRELANWHEKARRETGKKVPATIGIHNGHEYVDLGLSVLWATCNIGASRPEDYGDYFAWGETETKKNYKKDNCKTYEKLIGDIKGMSRDAARVKWGGAWRLPTCGEFDELLNNCAWAWTKRGGHAGYKVTGKNGNSIFLPAAGWRDGTSLHGTDSDGIYWSSTPREDVTQEARYLFFYVWDHYTCWDSRYYGYSVRPVVRL